MGGRVWGWGTRIVVSTVLLVLAVILGGVFLFVGERLFRGVESVVLLAVLAIGLAELGFVVAALAFLFAADRGSEYVSYRFPNRHDGLYTVGGTLGLYALALTAAVGVRALGGTMVGAPPAVFDASELRAILLAMVVLSVVVIGPAEELFFRGVVQSYLDGAFSRPGAIVVTSLLFAVVHVPTFASVTAGAAQWIAATTIFTISVVLGYLYARTDNLLVPAVAHGVYDATLFGLVYLGLYSGAI
jgi:membrane protease YdiL (CAAX protease family)